MTALLALALVLCRAVDDDGPRTTGLAAPALPQGESPVSAATSRAVEAGLAYLVGLQDPAGDGSFAVRDAANDGYAPLGVSALCTLALLARGNAPGRGPHGEVVARALDHLLLHADLAPGSPQYGYVSVAGDGLSRTHGHGYATLVLAQAYGMARGAERIRTALVAAVERIEAIQGAEGGFGYDPRPTPDHEGSVTICMLQALRAARDAGIQVDAGVVRRADDYVRRLQAPTGLFRYTLGDQRATAGLTAAAIATLNAGGAYDDAAIRAGIDAIWRTRSEQGEPPAFPEYERLYLAQAFWQLSDRSHFERWFAEESARLVRTQESDGSWRAGRFGSAYTTAVNCLVLALPDAELPIFQR
jgi:hypothetical protein